MYDAVEVEEIGDDNYVDLDNHVQLVAAGSAIEHATGLVVVPAVEPQAPESPAFEVASVSLTYADVQPSAIEPAQP